MKEDVGEQVLNARCCVFSSFVFSLSFLCDVVNWLSVLALACFLACLLPCLLEMTNESGCVDGYVGVYVDMDVDMVCRCTCVMDQDTACQGS